jgi:hypothetical protein
MALTYDEMMFECVLNNFEPKTHKKSSKLLSKSSLKKSSKSSKNIKDDEFFDNEKNTFKKLKIFYEKYNYVNITNYYNKCLDIIENGKDNMELKWLLTTTIINWGQYYNILYNFYKIILSGYTGIKYFVDTNIDIYNKIQKEIKSKNQNDKNVDISSSSLELNINNFLNFYEKHIDVNKKTVSINNLELISITNNISSTSFNIDILDIMNRYFKYLSYDFNIINIGIYFPNNETLLKCSDNINIVKRDYELIINLINNLNIYRITSKINNFEIKYQDEKNLKINNNEYIKELPNKLNFIINITQYYTLNNNKLLKYLDNRLLEGGNLIFFFYFETPIKSIIIKELSKKFKKVIITKSFLSSNASYVFIGKGFMKNPENFNLIKINNFINKSFNIINKKIDNMFYNISSPSFNNLDEKELIKEINKRYLDTYKWCINNNFDVVNLFDDIEENPKLISKNKIVNYLFPNQKGIDKNKIKLFDVSIYSITPPIEATKISNTIQTLFKAFYKDSNINFNKNFTITDGTANVGGNTLNFSSYFSKVNSIELFKDYYNVLKYNCVNIYKRKNINFYNASCLDIVPTLKQDVIFIDPPWKGKFYKIYDKINLNLGSEDIYDVIKKWFDLNLAKLFVIKCPRNFNFDPFILNFTNVYIQKIRNYNIIYVHNFNK